MSSIFIHLRVIYTIVVDFYTFEGILYIVGIHTFEVPTSIILVTQIHVIITQNTILSRSCPFMLHEETTTISH